MSKTMRWTERLASASYVRKWLVLAPGIGVVAGLGAITFIHSVEFASELLLGGLGAYHPSTPIGEADEIAASAGFARPWAIPLVVAFGALISGFLVFRWAPEAEGHGTDAAIEAVHHDPKNIRPRVAVVKMVASALTIGSGGSGGREGPTAQISAAFGSFLARRLNLTPADARIAVTVGIGAGIGAIFRAPLGGAVIGAEILYLEDLESEALLPSFIASIIGFSIFGFFEGFTPIFGFVRGYSFSHPVELVYFVILGVAAGLVGRIYASTFYRTIGVFHRLKIPRYLKPALGGILVGWLGLVFPAALGTGYGHVQEAMTAEIFDIPLWVLLSLPFVKILATSLSIGSGASAGIFGPGMVIGGLLGAGLWRIGEGAPGMTATAAPFVVVGMIACFGSISHAYLAMMLMVAEMTGTLALLPPAMITLAAAALIVGDRTIYTSQLRNRASSVAYRTRLGLPLMVTIPIERAMTAPRLAAPASWSDEQVLAALDSEGLPGAPLIDADERYVGVALREERNATTAIARKDDYPSIPLTGSLDAALDVLSASSVNWVPVVTIEGRLAGIISTSDLLRAYQGALGDSQRKLAAALVDSKLFEGEIGEGSAAVGPPLRLLGLPAGTVILTVWRADELLFPSGDTRLQAGDRLRFIGHAQAEQEMRRVLGLATDDGAAASNET